MPSAIYYHPEAYTVSGPKLMGRNAAGASFLRGFLSHARTETFWVQVERREDAKPFLRAVREAGRRESVRTVTNAFLGPLSSVGTVSYPGPDIGRQAWFRAVYGHAAWSVCGITHTTASERVMDAVAGFLTDPVQPWDAVICTSRAVKDNVLRIVQAQADYLVARLGVQRLVMPQLPVIPLGINAGDCNFSSAQRVRARQRLCLGRDDVAVLFVGRLSFHAKAHPLAMYQALERALPAVPGGGKVALVECGWHANGFIATAFQEAARQLCPGVRVVTLDGRVPEQRQTAWAGADIFCSLSDNIQETFGLTPIEAMAAGLPVVVSDWDGYKESVRDGIDGFRIPTMAPGPGLGGDLAQRYARGVDTYDAYCGHACSFVAVDVEAATQAFARLFAAPELRRTMGGAGRRRARDVYDWAVIIPQYETLWEQLADIRKEKAPACKSLPHPWPARLDPFYAFAGYPSAALQPQALLALTDADSSAAMERVTRYSGLAMVNFARDVLPSLDEVGLVLEASSQTPRPAVDLVRAIPAERQAVVFRALTWLVKLGILRPTSTS